MDVGNYAEIPSGITGQLIRLETSLCLPIHLSRTQVFYDKYIEM